MHYVYMVRCADGSLYTGWTTDVESRIKAHNGELPGGAKYTRGRRPCRVVHVEEFETKSEALKREIAIKKLRPEAKEKLIENQAENTDGQQGLRQGTGDKPETAGGRKRE